MLNFLRHSIMRNFKSFFCISICLMVLSIDASCTESLLHHRIFVSSSEGDDHNSGLNERFPVKSIGKALTLGDTILLKANDVFYEYVIMYNQFMSRYGDGDDPEINGLRQLRGRPWEKNGENVWCINLTTAKDAGYRITGTTELNNVGCFYFENKDELRGRKCWKKEDMHEDWDFFQSDVAAYHKRGNSCFDSLFLYYRGNPNDVQMAISVGSHYGIKLYDSSVEHVRVIGFGTGGINLFGSSNVRNCRVDIIGGSMMLGGDANTCLGNGIDFFVSSDAHDCIIENNYISRCYDCGGSIQGERSGQATPKNIIYRNNLIANCCQGWEDFLRNDKNVMFENCVFENNTVLNIGKTTGFSYPKIRFKYCHVLGNNYEGDRGMIIRNNTFVGGNFYCSGAFNGKYTSNVWIGNVCYIKRGDYILSNYWGTKDVIRIPTEKGNFNSLSEATADAIKRYREMTGDVSTRFVIKNERTINRRINKLIKKYQNNYLNK